MTFADLLQIVIMSVLSQANNNKFTGQTWFNFVLFNIDIYNKKKTLMKMIIWFFRYISKKLDELSTNGVNFMVAKRFLICATIVD